MSENSRVVDVPIFAMSGGFESTKCTRSIQQTVKGAARQRPAEVAIEPVVNDRGVILTAESNPSAEKFSSLPSADSLASTVQMCPVSEFGESVKPPLRRYVLAHTAGISAGIGMIGALTLMLAVLHSEGALILQAGVLIWFVVAAVPVAAIGWILGIIFMCICSFRSGDASPVVISTQRLCRVIRDSAAPASTPLSFSEDAALTTTAAIKSGRPSAFPEERFTIRPNSTPHMNTRHPIPFLAIALSIVLLLPPCSSVAEEETLTLPFLKVGSTYRLTGGGSLPTTVKILEAAGGAWFRVEYRVSPNSLPVPQPGVTTATMWVNFNTVAGVSEYKNPEVKGPVAK